MCEERCEEGCDERCEERCEEGVKRGVKKGVKRDGLRLLMPYGLSGDSCHSTWLEDGVGEKEDTVCAVVRLVPQHVA